MPNLPAQREGFFASGRLRKGNCLGYACRLHPKYGAKPKNAAKIRSCANQAGFLHAFCRVDMVKILLFRRTIGIFLRFSFTFASVFGLMDTPRFARMHIFLRMYQTFTHHKAMKAKSVCNVYLFLLCIFTIVRANAQCSCPANPSPPPTPIITIDVAGPGGSTAPLQATGNNQVLCLRSSVGSATYNGPVDFGGFTGVTLCIGPNVTFGYNATLADFAAGGHRITNNGTFNRRSFPGGGTTATFDARFSLVNSGTVNLGDPFFSALYDVNFNVGSTITNNTSGVINIFGDLFNRTTVNNNGSIDIQTGGIALGGVFNQISGTITSGGSIAVSASATVSGGNIILNGSSLRVNGNYTQTGGNVGGGGSILTAGCGTVNVDGVSRIDDGVFGFGTGQIGLCDPSTRNVNTGVSGETGFDQVNGPPGLLILPQTGRLKCDCFVALPVEFVYFRAAYADGKVTLNWATASEKDNDFFSVERSSDGTNFAEIARVDGAGNSSRLLTYQTVDASPLEGVSYYRLKQTDFDGKFSYSRVVPVNAGVVSGTTHVFPNPVSQGSFVQVAVANGERGDVFVTIFDQIGRQCFAGRYTADAIPSIPVSDFARSSGLYVLQARRGNMMVREKLLVQ